MSHHDLSPARMLRRLPLTVPSQARDPRSTRDAAGTGGWVHLRAWMRGARPQLPRPAAG
jgi:SH3-like domain-containing protein